MDTNTVKRHLDYPDFTMFQMIEKMAEEHPTATAMEFFGKKTNYRTFVKRIEKAARAFLTLGIKKDDRVTICLPNVPQALICFYALNRIGAVANMVHPLSACDEITFYVSFSNSKVILTADMFCEKVENALKNVPQPVTVLVTRVQDEFNPALRALYTLKTGKKFLKYPDTDHAMLWSRFLSQADMNLTLPEPEFDISHTSVILYSGGTSGTPKGICLTDLNFNALALQATEAIQVPLSAGDKMLSCMPCFHGFGLGINLHTVLTNGAICILMPSFTIKSYARMLAKKKPNFIAGVPTIFEALLHTPSLEKTNLGFLKGMFCGGDSLSVELKRKVDTFLREHGANIQVREGYGLTECVTASCLTPKDDYREGSIGLPFPDTFYKIVAPDTENEMPYGKEGEIILTGPTLMLKYLDNRQETANTLRTLSDGRVWLYTGDLGYMDEDGYIYFCQRIKRMIITNGYNVYPGRIENFIDSCPEVAYSCVIGVKDPHRMQRIKAFVVLKDGVAANDECKERIMQVLRQKVARYALPKEIEFRKELPKTLVGKVAYRLLEEEENNK